MYLIIIYVCVKNYIFSYESDYIDLSSSRIIIVLFCCVLILNYFILIIFKMMYSVLFSFFLSVCTFNLFYIVDNCITVNFSF